MNNAAIKGGWEGKYLIVPKPKLLTKGQKKKKTQRVENYNN